MEAALSLERIHQFLVQGGFMFDLVFLMREGGDYLPAAGYSGREAAV